METTAGRPGLKISSRHPLVADLEALRAKHDLAGCLLIAFDTKADRTSVTAAAKHSLFFDAMKRLGDQVLARIDNGEFDV